MNSCSSLLSIIYQFIILSFIRVLFVLPFFPHFTMSIVTIVNSHLIVDLFLLLLLLLSFATNNAIMLNSKDIIEALVSSVCVYFIILILLKVAHNPLDSYFYFENYAYFLFPNHCNDPGY